MIFTNLTYMRSFATIYALHIYTVKPDAFLNSLSLIRYVYSFSITQLSEGGSDRYIKLFVCELH